jgi:hypothetical protein
MRREKQGGEERRRIRGIRAPENFSPPLLLPSLSFLLLQR